MGRQIRTILAVFAAAGLAGCASTTTSNLDLSDRTVALPTLRLAADFGGREIEDRSVLHTSHAVELEFSGGRGNDTEFLASAQRPIVFGGETFLAPQELRADFDFRFLQLAYRYRHFFAGPGIGVEGVAGGGCAVLALTVTGTTQRASERLNDCGLVLGLGTVWRITPKLSFQARGTGFGSGEAEGITNATRLDLQLAYALGQHAGVRAGWATWNVRSDRDTSFGSSARTSPIRVRLSGPTLGLELMF